ncbi:MAG: phage tail protein [Cognaticolwellia aestuarii]
MASNYSLELELPAESFLEAEAKVSQAIRRVLRRSAAWLRTESIKRLSKQLNIKQSALKNRFNVRILRKGNVANIWVGIMPLSAINAGAAKQDDKGVSVRGNFYRNAFLQTINGEYAIWKREGKKRYPVKKQTIDFSADVIAITKQLESELNRKFNNWLREALA